MDRLLGPPQPSIWRVRTAMTLWTLLLYLLFGLLQLGAVALGRLDAGQAGWLTAYFLGGNFVFFALVRSRWSQRISTTDPSLTFWQSLHGLSALLGAYAISGPTRGGVLAVLVLVLSYAMFGLSVAQARGLTVLSLLGLAGVMVWKCRTDPLAYPVEVELVLLAYTSIVLLGISALSVRMGRLRQRLHEQKVELGASLEQIRILATRDELTGLVNRRRMMDLLTAEQVRQRRGGHAMALVLLDLDHFKRVNDTYGHQAGDAVLRTFAGHMQLGLRQGDVLARWGGEEFLLLLPGTSQDEAAACVERMRRQLATVTMEDAVPGMQLTFSAGLAVCRPGDRIDALIERADQALYRAKQAGRNCTVTA